MLQFDIYGITDVGRIRPRNEDQFLIATLGKTLEVSQSSLDLEDQSRLFGNTQGRILLVADGMGGHSAGDRASYVVIQAFADYVLNMLRWYFRADPGRESDFIAELRDAVLRCQKQIREEGQLNPEVSDMGTTLTLAYIIWPRMFVVHVGDSRCYLLRKKTLLPLTKDHTFAQYMSDAKAQAEEGNTTADQTLPVREVAPDNPLNHVLWNVIGGSGEEPEPDISCVELEFDDRLLLCTDGLTKHLSTDELSERLQEDLSAAEICRGLADAANTAGGTDNITAIVAKIPPAVVEPVELANTASASQSAAESEMLQNRLNELFPENEKAVAQI